MNSEEAKHSSKRFYDQSADISVEVNDFRNSSSFEMDQLVTTSKHDKRFAKFIPPKWVLFILAAIVSGVILFVVFGTSTKAPILDSKTDLKNDSADGDTPESDPNSLPNPTSKNESITDPTPKNDSSPISTG